MAYTDKFQRLAEAAQAQVSSVEADEVDALVDNGAIALDIRDRTSMPPITSKSR